MKKTLIILVLSAGTFASSRADTGRSNGDKDSLLPVRTGLSKIEADEPLTANLLDIEAGYSLSGDHRRALIGLVRLARMKAAIRNRKIRLRFYNDLARVSARLRLYPLAMKCYYSAVHLADESDSEALVITEDDLPADSVCEGRWPTTRSRPIKMADLLAAFEDGKEAISYALLAEVKQPVPGKRRSFTHINNVGHMFITLIKYNKDKSIVCRSFGFYPHKSTLLSGTPFCPRSSSVIKDDAGHAWDEIAGKFISPRRFGKIIGILRSYDERPYDLNRNNCTDFGLTIARLGGIGIADATGHWPLGNGNNPGSAGQNILEGKVCNIDEDNTDPLFVSD